jgi:hypothetical protein
VRNPRRRGGLRAGMSTVCQKNVGGLWTTLYKRFQHRVKLLVAVKMSVSVNMRGRGADRLGKVVVPSGGVPEVRGVISFVMTYVPPPPCAEGRWSICPLGGTDYINKSNLDNRLTPVRGGRVGVGANKTPATRKRSEGRRLLSADDKRLHNPSHY